MRYSDKRRLGFKSIWVIHPDETRTFERYETVYNQSGTYSSKSDKVVNPLTWENGGRWRNPSAYEFYYNEFTGWYGDYIYQDTPGGYKRIFSGALQDSFAEFPYSDSRLQWAPYPGELYARSLDSCLQAVLDQKIDLSSALAEGRKTVVGVAERVTKVLNAFLTLKKGKGASKAWRDASAALGYKVTPQRVISRKLRTKSYYRDIRLARTGTAKVKAQGKVISSDWLELQYGIMPLVGDIDGLIEETKSAALNAFVFSTTGQAKGLFDYEIVGPSSAGSKPVFNVTGFQYYRTILTYELSDVATRLAARNGVTNPLPMIWNILPWSFVGDWVVPIGNWLQNFTADQGLRFVSGVGTRGVKYTFTGKTVPDGSAGHYVSGEITCSGSVSTGGRGIFTSTPIPALYIKSPFSTIHVVNAVALVRSIKR